MKCLGMVLLVAGFSAINLGQVQADLVSYGFTATDGFNVGTGTFSYDSTMMGYSFNSTEAFYYPNATNSPVTITFSSAVGTFNSNVSEGVFVDNNDPTQYDDLQISVDSPVTTGGTAQDVIIFKDNMDTALSSTALPTTINLSSFSYEHDLEYYDNSIGTYRDFNITSLTLNLASVPEPASFLMVGMGFSAVFGYRQLRRRVKHSG